MRCFSESALGTKRGLLWTTKNAKDTKIEWVLMLRALRVLRGLWSPFGMPSSKHGDGLEIAVIVVAVLGCVLQETPHPQPLSPKRGEGSDECVREGSDERVRGGAMSARLRIQTMHEDAVGG